jgi:NAD(P)-dependent dehydrogenase (short-subunit alcohol dehydrogenase family)
MISMQFDFHLQDWRLGKENMDSTMIGKNVVITGATSGIGLEVASQLAQMDANVIAVGRNEQRCQAALKNIKSRMSDAKIEFLNFNISEQAEVRRLAAEISRRLEASGKKLDVLINNAGTFQYWLTLTLDGFEMQWAVNYLAPFLLTHELLPLLQAAPFARVITTSSGSHYHTRLHWDDIQLRRRYNGLLAYKQTKLADVLFSMEFNRRNKGTMQAFAADPGLVDTNIGMKADSLIARWIWSIRRKGGITAEESARGLVFLASELSIQGSQEVYWKHGKPKAPNRYALDEEIGRRLWELSEKMCGIKTGERLS